MRLGLQALGQVAGPRVDPRDLEVGIVHLGPGRVPPRAPGRLHRGRDGGGAGPWGICGASRRSRAVVDALTEQDGLYGVLERGPEEDGVRVVGAVREALVATEQPDALRDRLAAAGTHVVTLTVTEAGYQADHPDFERDLAGGAPRTPVGSSCAGSRRAGRPASTRRWRSSPATTCPATARCCASCRGLLRRRRDRRPCRLDHRSRRLPLHDGRPHRARRHGRRPRHGEPPDRRPRRGDRRRRAVQPVGARGRLPRAPARVGGRRARCSCPTPGPTRR